MKQKAVAVRQFAQAPCFEWLERRMLLSADPTLQIDPFILASMTTPKLRNPGQGVYEAEYANATEVSTPSLATSFNAVDYPTNSTNNAGWSYIPPDPIGAAGPNHVVNIVNCTIEWYTKTGTKQYSHSLGNQGNGTPISGAFFSSLNPADGTFDPKVIYDQYNSRFVVISLEQQDTANGDSVNSSRVLIAVSDDSDPNGTWYFQAIDTKLNIDGLDLWIDYPGLGLDSQAIYLTGNMFGFGNSGMFGGTRLWIIDKSGLYSGGSSSFNEHDPQTLSDADQISTIQPAHMYGTAPGSTGTFLVASGLFSGANDYLQVIRVTNPLSSPTFTSSNINLGNVHNTSAGVPAAPQLGGTSHIDAGDERVFNAVWRNNNLYLANTVNPPSGVDAGTATAHWYRLNATASTVSLADQGNIGGEDIASGAYTYYPAVTVDYYGNMAVGFAASGSSFYAGAYYTGRLATDPAGTVQSTTVLAAGLDYYNRTFGGSRNRWGDYSGISLDPSDEVSFWVYNEYAMTRSGSSKIDTGRWATRWGSFALGSAPTSAIPGVPDLDTLYDTGISNSDNLMRLNNGSGAGSLLFDISGTVAGALVEVVTGGIVIGSATALGTSTAVTTDGITLLSDGPHLITVRQTETGRLVSAESSALTITVDATAPSALPVVINDGNIQRSMINQIGVSFSEAVVISAGGLDVRLRSGGAVPNTTVNVATTDNVNYVLTFSGTAVIGGSLADGLYQVVRLASGIQDPAGNALAANAIQMFHRLFGDSDGDRDVDSVDLTRFRLSLKTPSNYVWYFDYQFADPAGGVINAADYAQLKQRLTRLIIM